MKTWITLLSSVVVLSFVHFLLELWRCFLDFTFVLPVYAGDSVGTMAQYALGYTIVFAAWLLALASARQGKRGSIIAALILDALFFVGLDLATIFVYCPGGCEHVVFDITTSVALIIGALVIFGWVTNLRRPTLPAQS